MAGFSMSVSGLDKLHAGLVKGGADAAKLAAQAINEEAQLIFKQSQDEVPVGPPRKGSREGTGALQGSGVLDMARVIGSTVEASITYGGPAAEYAFIVHEMPDTTNWTKPGSKGRYLSDPVNEHANKLIDRINDRFQRLLKDMT